MRILSNVVRYHRKATPTGSHTNYISLNREDRLKVLKLSAMLRIADALDRGHVQRVRSFTLETREEDLILRCASQGDLSIEKYGLALKSDMFEEVFGYHVVIE
jgi:exopolyphosphatase/guanosine-5'-triphosphate,3'-diphosphate pyrophosphatase